MSILETNKSITCLLQYVKWSFPVQSLYFFPVQDRAVETKSYTVGKK